MREADHSKGALPMQRFVSSVQAVDSDAGCQRVARRNKLTLRQTVE
jgi:hypothetical protein